MFPTAAIPLPMQLVYCLAACGWSVVLGAFVCRIRFGPDFFNRPMRMLCALSFFEFALRIPVLTLIFHRVYLAVIIWDIVWIVAFIVGAEIGLAGEHV